MFDPILLQNDFPILRKKVHGKRLVYLDNAATSQKPQAVINAITEYYTHHNANVHRGVHTLSDESTHIWEEGRKTIANFFGVDDQELVLVRNTTEAINGIAYGWGLDHLASGDVIFSTEMEHHSNLTPWQEICKRTGASLSLIAVTDDGQIDLNDLEQKIKAVGDKLKLIAITHVSNTLGTLNPVQKIHEIINNSRSWVKKPLILIDGAQSAPHMKIDFHKLDIDFFIFSGHKMLGPMGIGGVLIKKTLLQSGEVKPWLFGGGMIEAVHTSHSIFHTDANQRFTAGTPDVASIAGLAEACKYLQDLGMENIYKHDHDLVKYTIERLQEFPQIQIVGPTKAERIGSVAFIYEGVHPHDVAQILDSEGVAVRSGHHCTMPLHTKFNWAGTTRLSFQIYNTKDDIDACVEALKKVKQIFGK